MNPVVLRHVQSIVADVFAIPLEQITLESSPDTIASWDSLQHLNLVLAIERELNIQFTPEEIEQLSSVESITVLLDRKLRAAGRTV